MAIIKVAVAKGEILLQPPFCINQNKQGQGMRKGTAQKRNMVAKTRG